MTVATRLRGAFALYIALLAAVLVYHVRAARHAADSGRALTAIAARHRVASSGQSGRIAEMSSVAEKYLVTRDSGYLGRFIELAEQHRAELLLLAGLSMTTVERDQLRTLQERWSRVDAEVRSLRDPTLPGAQDPSAVLARLEPMLDGIARETGRLAESSQGAMAAELARSESAANNAEKIAWATATLAMVLALLLSAMIVRSILHPLARLAAGTREISAGRLGFRLNESGSDELAQVAREFNAMTVKLDELDRMKRDFMSNVSHDLKTPLSSMQEATSVMLDELPGPVTEKQRRLLMLNLESGRRLSAMIAKLLELSRLEATPSVTEDFDVIDFAALVRGCVERAGAAPAQAPRIELLGGWDRLTVRGDFDALVRVVDNLLENAMKFSPVDSIVRVQVVDEGDSVRLMVADQGPGVADEDKERVFERFYQTAAGRAVASRGVGLGLAICRRIVEVHGGSIHVEDNTPAGAVFVVALPAHVGSKPVAPVSAGAAA